MRYASSDKNAIEKSSVLTVQHFNTKLDPESKLVEGPAFASLSVVTV